MLHPFKGVVEIGRRLKATEGCDGGRKAVLQPSQIRAHLSSTLESVNQNGRCDDHRGSAQHHAKSISKHIYRPLSPVLGHPYAQGVPILLAVDITGVWVPAQCYQGGVL